MTDLDDLPFAFDGPDAAGKTTLARQVANHVSRQAVGASVDAWHNPRDVRLRRGDQSPEGYYLDSFDLAAPKRDLLTPFRDGAPTVRTAPLLVSQRVAPDAALLLDGVFLLRPELVAEWDLRVYLHVPEQVTLSRALVRDSHVLGGDAAVRRRYERRYLPGQGDLPRGRVAAAGRGRRARQQRLPRPGGAALARSVSEPSTAETARAQAVPRSGSVGGRG